MLGGIAAPAWSATAVAVDSSNNLLRFDTSSPGTTSSVPITGLVIGDTLAGIDFRPGTGQLYGLGQGSRLYTIDLATGAATQVGADGSFTLSGTSFGFDFNPVPDRIRLTSNTDQNLRLNPSNGTLVATDGTLAYAAGDPNAGANPNVTASAYTNSFGGATATTLYSLDTALDTLVIQNPPNSGTLNTVVGGGLGVDAQGPAAFDIQALPGGGNAAFAALTTDGAASALYTIDLTTGAAALVGNIGSGATLVSGLSIVPTVLPTAVIYGINDANGNLVRFNSNNPSTIISSVPITGLVGSDSIVGIDFRPATGQLYALGGGSLLYTINPATGAATQVGSDGAFTLVGTVVGFDFNPTVDRIRVVTDADQNLRLNPNDGTLVATDGTLAYAAGDPNAGANPNVVASGYTNNFAGATTTTLYDIDSALDTLATQNPPNSGTLNTVAGAGLGINALDVGGFDIQTRPDGSNIAFAALTTDSTSSALYSVDLTTGAATQIGASPIGGAAPILLRGLAVAPPGSFQFSSPTYAVSENGPVATITINRLTGGEGVVTVRLETTDGTATSPADYSDSDQVVVFGPGETTKTVQIPIVLDNAMEADETVNLVLSDPTGGATLGTASTAVLTIINVDRTAPTVTINQAAAQADPSASSPINFTVVFDEPVAGFGDAAADVALSGTAGATTATVTAINSTTYTVEVSGMTSNGTVTVTIPAAAAADTSPNANPNDASTSTDNSVTYSGFNQAPVNSVPDADLATVGNQASAVEDTPLVFSAVGSSPNPITVSDPDAGGAALTVTITVPNAPGSTIPNGTFRVGSTVPAGVTVTGNGTSSVTLSGAQSAINTALNGSFFTPRANANGNVTLTIVTNDGGNSGLGGALSDTDTLAIAIAPVNDAPSAQNQSVGAAEDTPLAITLPVSDVDSSAFTYEIVSGPANGTLSGSGATRTYTPNANFTGTDSFTFRANDGSLNSNPATISITVGGSNDAPVAVADAASTDEDTPLSVQVLANDTDADSDGLSVQSVAVTAATNGTLSISADKKSVLFTPASDFSGAATFGYTVSDGVLASTASVSVTVRAVNDAPVAVADTASTSAGNAVNVPVLGNDSDVDGGALTVSVVDGSGTRGTLSISADKKSVLFTPEAGFSGPTSFGYTVSDGTASSSARATVTVTSGPTPNPTTGNRAPIAVADSYSARGPLQVLAAAGVLANDTDADGQALRATLNSVPAHGTLRFGSDGSFTYTPAVGYSGRDSFTYRANDGQAQSAVTTVSLSVASARDITPPALALAGGAVRVERRLIPLRGSAFDVYVLRSGPVVSSGLKSVSVQLQRSGGDYWNGRAYQRTPFNLPTQKRDRSFFTVPSSAMPPLSQAPGGRYKWTATALDNAGNLSRATQFMLVDTTAPRLLITTPAAGSDNIARVSRLESVSGRSSEAAKIEVVLRNSSGAYFNGRTFFSAPAFLPAIQTASTWALRLPQALVLAPGNYTLLVRATDAAGNVGTAQRSVQVSSTPAG